MPLVVAAAAAILGAPSRADANFAVRFFDGTNTLTVVDGTAADGNTIDPSRITVNAGNAGVQAFITASGFDITGSTFSFRNGTGPGGTSVMTDAHTEVERTGAGSATLTITSGYDGFTLPVGGTLFTNSTITFSATPAGANSFAFANFIDNVPPVQNLASPTGVSGSTGPATLGPPPANLSTGQTTFNRTTSPFQAYNLSTITLTNGDFVSYTATTNISAAPAPAGLVLALTGIPLLGLGLRFRRRRDQAGV